VYTTKPSFVYGFHGTDEDIAYKLVNKIEEFKASKNSYDWLGEGVYFWENDLDRALQFAKENIGRSKSDTVNPSAVGVVIDLGNCFDLLNQKHLKILSSAYEKVEKIFKETGVSLPVNSEFGNDDFDFRKRELDCAVVRYAVDWAAEEGMKFDTVRAAFLEGEELYPGAGFKSKNHIQIAVLNPNCIKGVFFPRNKK